MSNPGSPGQRAPSVVINGQRIPLQPRETILQAALRGGVPFPNSCRVGGCGSCRCRLVEGQVKELTETSYLLSAEELDGGFILACQSVPLTDVSLEVDLAHAGLRGSPGKVVEQERLTHDITRLTVQLEAPLDYRAGQFANLSLEGLPGVVRSYSFATPADRSGRVSFFVRKVPGGAFSTLINDEQVVGRAVRVDGPVGDFFLRPGDAPLLFVAGGSGLAPILAVLKAAVAAGVTRDAVVLFGAREERDLYALDELEALGKAWRGAFRFVPVLSGLAADASWSGARGLVTEHLAAHVAPGAHAYLCGPPPMIDAAIPLLKSGGVAPAHLHFDRFTTQADIVTASGGAVANALQYLKFFGFHLIGLLALASLLAGGAATTFGLLSVLGLYMLGDAVCGDDTSTPKYAYPGILTAQLWLGLPLLVLIVFCAVWTVSPGDPLGFGAWVSSWRGVDVLAARDATTFGHHVSAWVLTGLMIGLVGTITAHELTHRTWDPVSMFIGRWLLAFSFDTIFAIEHVYGHHRYVSTIDDPATAPRGRNVYAHIVVSTVRGNVSAWKIETERLKKKRVGVFSWHNAFLRGHLMSVALIGLAALVGGWAGAVFFIASALWGKSLLEIVNYMEHYGMVRNPETPVQPRHSWNTNRRISSWTMFNLTRHSHHHAQGEVPYHELRPYPDAPMMINGYLTTIIVAMIPPLWHRLMTPRVLAWDRDFASAEERVLATAANARSGLPALAARA